MDGMELRAPKGSRKNKTIKGRGYGSRKGGTCGKGTKGQNSRSGGGVRPGFEGGQMPLYRRIARRGFSNYPFKKEFIVINIDELEKKYNNGDTVNLSSLKEKNIVKKSHDCVKILGNGELTKKLVVEIEHVSSGAKAKIEKAGGNVSAPKEAEEKEE